jgi:hypothetical protein
MIVSSTLITVINLRNSQIKNHACCIEYVDDFWYVERWVDVTPGEEREVIDTLLCSAARWLLIFRNNSNYVKF